MSVFHSFKTIALEINLPIKIHLVECFHGNLALAMICRPVMFAQEMEVMFNRSSGILGLFILAGSHGGGNAPKGHKNGDGGQDTKEDGGVESAADLSCEIERDDEQERKQQNVGEALGPCTVRW